jgi:hypothetical protein
MTEQITVVGKGGFDFWQGRWEGHNRKLLDVLDPECDEWVEFDAVCLAQRTLGGLGAFETFLAEDMPGRGRVEGMSVKLFDPESGTWKIWWMSTAAPGDIGTPVEGTWTGHIGQFFGDDELNGRKIRVQYEWTVYSPESARWRQFFSFDGGETWQHNWTAEHHRVD